MLIPLNGGRGAYDKLRESYLRIVPSGFNVIAGNDVPADTTVVAIPFSLAITPDVSKAALKALIREADESHLLDSLSERQLVCTYVCLHQIAKDAASR